MGPRQEDGMESQIKALREVIERATDVEAKLTRAQAEINNGIAEHPERANHPRVQAMQATINDSLAEWRDIRLRAENVLSRLTSQEDMTDRFRKLIGLSSTAEFNAELAKMSPKELFAFKQWVQHDIDQKDAGTLQHKENAALAEQAAQVLESYGFGQPGKETLEDVMHLLSKEEQLLVTEVLARMRST